MEDQNTKVDPISVLTERLDRLEAENAAYKKQLNQSATPEVKPTPTIPDKPFSVGGTSYCFLVPVFRHENQEITAQDALSDKDLLAHLVKIKSGIIAEVA